LQTLYSSFSEKARFSWQPAVLEGLGNPEKFLVNLMKNLSKQADSLLLFVRYPFIMDTILIVEEYARG
jgi:hypothetical protein